MKNEAPKGVTGHKEGAKEKLGSGGHIECC